MADDEIDPEVLDDAVETERQWLVSSLRRIADRLEAMCREDIIEPLTMISEQATTLIRRAVAALRISLAQPPTPAD